MTTTAYFINIGQGNMTLLLLSDGTIMLYDCNVTEENKDRVLSFLDAVLPRKKIDIFVNSHRDADHMRGVKTIHKHFPIGWFWDSGVTGTSPTSQVYLDYMDLRRRVGFTTVERLTYYDYGQTRLQIMNAKNDDLPNNPNAQSIVMKVEHRDRHGKVLSSLMLTGDTDASTWKTSIVPSYTSSDLSSSILLGSHHGSKTFFEELPNSMWNYTTHIERIRPAMTVISVGPNAHGHPTAKALRLYRQHSTGSNKGNKIFRTDQQGDIQLLLKDGGGWSMTPNFTPVRYRRSG